jgi:1-pyrroline-5-carboxylate dehydrogenase
MGPLMRPAAVACFQKAVRRGKRDGRLLCGGRVLTQGAFAHGHFVEPTLFGEVLKDSILCREECPIPILAVTEVKSFEEAIALANASPFELSAGIFTQVDAEQEQFFEQIQAGTVYCNRRNGATSGIRPGVQSLGGWKHSGSAGKNALGPYFITQFMREQSRTVYW